MPYARVEARALLLAPLLLGALPALAIGAPATVTATEVERHVVYHSPQSPGYTCWVGAWVMPDATVRVAFHQATGPLSGRPKARPDVRAALGWPPPDHSPGYDMTGTAQEIVTLESRDGGRTWTPFASEPFGTPMNGIIGGFAVLPDGGVLRTVWGMYLPYYDVPQTGYVQRSDDGGATWGPPITLADPAHALTLPKRVRVLRDGRIAAVGGSIALTDEVRTLQQGLTHIEAAIWLSSDGGATWSEPIATRTPGVGPAATEESYLAELPDGRLLVINRTYEPSRWQSVLRPEGDGYVVESEGPAPFPHSGMPDVLWAREGVALHIASSNVSWTADAGRTWTDLGFGTLYYPSSVQLPDGRILSFCHRGSDDPYDGTVDQQIEVVSFRLDLR